MAEAQVVVAVSATNSEAERQATATCPPGRRVLAGGGSVVAGGGQVMLVGLVPSSVAGVDRFTARAAERAAGSGANWRVAAYAVCGDNLPGLQIVSSSLDAPAGAPSRQVLAPCPTGKVVVGMGASVDGGQGKVLLRHVVPAHPVQHVAVTVGEDTLDGLVPPPWYGVTAYAICANGPRPGYVLATNGGQPRSDAQKQQVSVTCPAGTQALGVGETKSDPDDHAFVERMGPAEGSGSWRRVGFTEARPPSTPAHPWSLTIVAICTG
jgi:hypothetical protein